MKRSKQKRKQKPVEEEKHELEDYDFEQKEDDPKVSPAFREAQLAAKLAAARAINPARGPYSPRPGAQQMDEEADEALLVEMMTKWGGIQGIAKKVDSEAFKRACDELDNQLTSGAVLNSTRKPYPQHKKIEKAKQRANATLKAKAQVAKMPTLKE